MLYLNVEEAILSPSGLFQHQPTLAYHRFSYHRRVYMQLKKFNWKRKTKAHLVGTQSVQGDIAHRNSKRCHPERMYCLYLVRETLHSLTH